jgi:hypothetical protein
MDKGIIKFKLKQIVKPYCKQIALKQRDVFT